MNAQSRREQSRSRRSVWFAGLRDEHDFQGFRVSGERHRAHRPQRQGQYARCAARRRRAAPAGGRGRGCRVACRGAAAAAQPPPRQAAHLPAGAVRPERHPGRRAGLPAGADVYDPCARGRRRGDPQHQCAARAGGSHRDGDGAESALRAAHREDGRGRAGARRAAAAEAALGSAQPLRSRRALSRRQSRSFSVARLSCCFLPLARPTASLARPCFQYSSSGTRV